MQLQVQGRAMPTVDVVVVSRNADPLSVEVERGLRNQRGLDVCVHRIVGDIRSHESCRYQTIARARNEGLVLGTAPWLMFVDDDVVLEPDCAWQLVEELQKRPSFAALGADYLGESQEGHVAPHVAMGATLFRREIFRHMRFTWREDRCECQCCCDDLRRLRWGIDYWQSAKAWHLPKTNDKHETAHRLANRPHASTSNSRQPCRIPSVCLIACYFGPLPAWIGYYLLSCAHSPTIDFLLFTDQDDLPVAPPNVKFQQLSRAGFNTLATERIGSSITLGRNLKLCDFKPTYGHLFADSIKNYDYWGYADLDVIYGDIRRHLSAISLEEFDVFSSRQEYLVGHFTLLRNNSRLRTLYRQCIGFQAILQNPTVLSFDECGHQWEKLWAGEQLSSFAACDSMTHVVSRLVNQSELKACLSAKVLEWPELPKEGWKVHWSNGVLSNPMGAGAPMYLHFHAFKKNGGYQQPRPLGTATSFDITPHGFEPHRTATRMGSPEVAIIEG